MLEDKLHIKKIKTTIEDTTGPDPNTSGDDHGLGVPFLPLSGGSTHLVASTWFQPSHLPPRPPEGGRRHHQLTCSSPSLGTASRSVSTAVPPWPPHVQNTEAEPVHHTCREQGRWNYSSGVSVSWESLPGFTEFLAILFQPW